MTDLDVRLFADVPDPFARPAGALRPLDAAALPPSPPRSRVRAARAAALAAALLFEAAWLALVERRAALAPGWAPALALALPLAAAAAALAGAAGRGARGLGARAKELAALVVGPPVVFAFGTLLGAPLDAAGGAFAGEAARCAAVTALLAAAPFVVGLFALRRSFAAAAGWRTAALGVACGALAAATMSVGCPDKGALHVIVGHGAMMVIGGIAGAVAGRATRA